MPQVNRQRPAVTKRAAAPAGSLLDSAVDVGDLPDSSIKMVIYGENRVGKTTLACQFPKPLLLVGLEPNQTGGALSVRKVPGVKFLRLETVAAVLQLAGELVGNDHGYATVVIDSATSLQDIILKEILGLPAVPDMLTWGSAGRDEYRERSEKTRECLRPFLNLACHTVLTAKQRDHNPPKDDKPRIVKGLTIESFFAADLGGATVGWLHDACDYICRLYIAKETVTRTVQVGKTQQHHEEETGRLVRRLQTMYHPNFAAGFRSQNPDGVPPYVDEPTYDKIRAIIDSDAE